MKNYGIYLVVGIICGFVLFVLPVVISGTNFGVLLYDAFVGFFPSLGYSADSSSTSLSILAIMYSVVSLPIFIALRIFSGHRGLNEIFVPVQLILFLFGVLGTYWGLLSYILKQAFSNWTLF